MNGSWDKAILGLIASLVGILIFAVALAIHDAPSEADVHARATRFCELAKCEVVSCRIRKISGNRCTVRLPSSLQAIDCDDDVCFVMAGETSNEATVIIQQPTYR